jgi:xylulokinase
VTSRSDVALVADLGSTGLKVGLCTLDGTLIDTRHTTIATSRPTPGAAHQDAGEWWTLIAGFARELLAGADLARVAAVVIGGQYASVVPVDATGEPVGPCIMWSDAMGARHVRAKVGGPIAGLKPSAALTFVTKTGGAPSPSGTDGAGGILHLTNDLPEMLAQARWVLEPVDYLTMRFTGAPVATHASMFGWWLTDNRRIETLSYDKGLLKILGLDDSRLPPLVPFGSIAGKVTATAALATGVPEGTPVIAGIPDLHAAALGTGTIEVGGPGHLALSTTSWISAPVAKKKTDIFHSIATMPGLDASSQLIINNHEIGAKALEWLAAMLMVPSPVDFDALTTEAGTAEPGSGSVLFTPWLAGERSPVENHRARGGFHNLSLDTGRPEMIRAVLEGVAYNSRWLATYVDKFAGRTLSPLRLLGGGATSPLWCQIHADVLGRPVEQIEAPMVAQLRGAALLAGRSLGVLGNDEIVASAHVARRFEPERGTVNRYEALYDEFPKLMKSQAGMFRRLQRR